MEGFCFDLTEPTGWTFQVAPPRARSDLSVGGCGIIESACSYLIGIVFQVSAQAISTRRQTSHASTHRHRCWHASNGMLFTLLLLTDTLHVSQLNPQLLHVPPAARRHKACLEARPDALRDSCLRAACSVLGPLRVLQLPSLWKRGQLLHGSTPSKSPPRPPA